MSSAVFSEEYVPAIGRPRVRPAAPPVNEWTTLWSWRAMGENASGITFLCVLGWEVWRIGGQLFQFATMVGTAVFGGL